MKGERFFNKNKLVINNLPFNNCSKRIKNFLLNLRYTRYRMLNLPKLLRDYKRRMKIGIRLELDYEMKVFEDKK